MVNGAGSSTKYYIIWCHILGAGITLVSVLWRGWGQHIFLSLKSGGSNINLSNNDMASGCWIIRLQEADHLEQSLHKVDDLDHLLGYAGSYDFKNEVISPNS